MPTLALLDGHSLAYRAFYALPDDLATRSGQVTNSVYGFTRMLLKLLADHHPESVAVAWDTGRETFRTEVYEDYKAQRTAAPDVFRSQLPLIREVLDALGISQVELGGYEADDLIATLAGRAVAEGWDVVVVSGDRDTFQLIDQHVRVLYTRRGISDTVLADAAWVEQRFGVPPERYPDYAALRGDTSDNLPGIPGVGEKTAARLVSGYGGLEGIYEHLEEMTPKLRQNLAEYREQAFLNRRLTRLVGDVELDVSLDELTSGECDRERAQELFTSLEFHSLWDDIAELLPGGAPPRPQVMLDVVTRPATADEVATRRPLVLEPVWDGGELVGLVVPTGDEEAAMVGGEELDKIGPALTDPAHPKVLHDAKDLVRELLDRGVQFAGLVMDTAVAGYVLDPTSRSYGLAELADRYLGVELVSPDRDAEGGPAQGTLDLGGGPDLDAAGRRAVVVGRLAERLKAELESLDGAELYDQMEVPLVEVLARMEHTGIGVDRGYLIEMGESLRDQLATLERQIHDAANGPFNVNSTAQLREVLYDRLGLPVLKKTAKGAPSTDASVLAKLADAHPIVERLLRYRELEKLRSTYVDGYLPLVEADGRIHTRFNQMAAATGRLSSDHPNLQNIPVRSETGRTIRRAFVSRPGWRFVVADYSQIELRVLAHMTEDPGLLEAFSGEETDIHTATAARVFEVKAEHVTPEMRRRAKMINFGLLYGMEAYGLAERLEIAREEAQDHIDAYFEQFPQVREFMQAVVAEARRRGYTTTLFGRRRYLPELKSDNFRIRQMGERMALNAPVQGTAADIIKRAMVDLDRQLTSRRLTTAMLLQVHDELVLEAPDDELEVSTGLIVEVMEGVTELRVPLRAELATGRNLAECKG